MWLGKNPKLQDDGTVDMSASLMKIARGTSDAGASREHHRLKPSGRDEF